MPSPPNCSCPTRMPSLACIECSLFTLVQILCPGFDSTDATARSSARDDAVGIVQRLKERVIGGDQVREEAPPTSIIAAAATAAEEKSTSADDSTPQPSPEPNSAVTCESKGNNKRPTVYHNSPMFDRRIKRKTLAERAAEHGASQMEIFNLDRQAEEGKLARKSLVESLEPRRSGRPKEWPLWKAIDAISQQLELVTTDSSLSKAAAAAGIKKRTFQRMKSDVKCRLSNTIVDYWFNEGQDRLLTRIAQTESTIDIAMYILNNPSVATALKTAAEGGVRIRIMTDLTGARAESKDQLLELMQYDNIKVYHCTTLMQWKCAIFDARLLQLGSADWALPELLGHNTEYTLVFSGPVVQAFVGQLEGMYEEACKPLNAHGGPKIFYRTMTQALE